MIQAYFDQLKHVIDSYAVASFVLDAQVSFELRPGDQGFLLGSVLFLDQSIHRPALPVLEHKHTGETIVASLAPSLEVVLTEIAGSRGWI